MAEEKKEGSLKAEELLKRYCRDGEAVVLPGNPLLSFQGRIDWGKEEGPLWTYPATSVTMRFRGRKLCAVVTNLHSYWDNYLGFIVDGKEGKALLAKEGVSCIPLIEENEEGEHVLCLFKRQDACHRILLHGFLVDGGFRLLDPPPSPERKIEVYGDSVSAGEVSEALDCCGLPDPPHQGELSNSYASYAWILARSLNACIHDIAQGGAGLLDGTGFFLADRLRGMESIYDKAAYSPEPWQTADWDFTRYTPDVVIVALGQNDSHPLDYMAQDYEGEAAIRWRRAYRAFLERLRSIYPKAVIICATTILEHDESWDRAIGEVCEGLGDRRVFHFLYQENGKGTKGHVRRPEAEKMARELASFITSLEGFEKWKA